MAFRLFSREEKTSPAPERKASATGRVVALAAGAGRSVWSARDTGSLTRSGFLGNPIGFRSVKLIAEAAAAVPLICEDRERRYDTHPVIDLLRRPNPGQGRAELFEIAVWPVTAVRQWLSGGRWPQPGRVARGASRPAVGPDEHRAGRGWLADRLRIFGRRSQASLRHDRKPRSDLPHQELSST